MVWLSNTVGFWNFRPIPSSAIRVSSNRVRSVTPSNKTSPSSGLVLPVMMSIIVVLPAPLGPIMARISPGASVSDRLLMAWKPSNETCTPSRYSIAEVARLSMTFIRSLRRIRFADAVFERRTLGGGRHALRLVGLPPGIEGADDALGQQQCDQDEQRPQHEQPVRRQRTRGEHGLRVIDDDGAQRRTSQRAAAADRDPDHRLNRIARREFAGIDDADLRHIERDSHAG